MLNTFVVGFWLMIGAARVPSTPNMVTPDAMLAAARFDLHSVHIGGLPVEDVRSCRISV